MPGFCKVGRAARRIVSVSILTLMLVVTASAYTVVMRGGKRIEIPSHFLVTTTTLTYEVVEGVQITVQMAAIDIPATEKANHELPGSLLRRVQVRGGEPLGPQGTTEKEVGSSGSIRTITNRELEASMRRRRESETAYETRRKQLGLPSIEESRKRAAAESELIARNLEEKRMTEMENESYWRARASALRTEIAALDAELGYIRTRLEDAPFSTWGGSFTSVSSIIPFIPFGTFGGGHSFGSPIARPNVFTAPGPQIMGRVRFGGGATRGHVLVNPGSFRPARPTGFGPVAPLWPNVTVFGSGFPSYDYSYERSALITRFNELAATRAGLNARWRELEDEARRAGVPPGWLRP
jgi:hypothetical protein